MTADEVRDQVEQTEGFEVIDEVDVGTLDDVKEERTLLPPTKGVKLQIAKASPVANKEATYRQINLQLRLVDGITVAEGEEPKYKGMSVFTRVCYYADPTVYTKDFFKKRQHLVQLKYLKGACTLTDPNKVNDAFLKELTDQIVLADITQQKARPYTDAQGVEQPGEPSNEARNFRAVPVEEMV